MGQKVVCLHVLRTLHRVIIGRVVSVHQGEQVIQRVTDALNGFLILLGERLVLLGKHGVFACIAHPVDGLAALVVRLLHLRRQRAVAAGGEVSRVVVYEALAVDGLLREVGRVAHHERCLDEVVQSGQAVGAVIVHTLTGRIAGVQGQLQHTVGGGVFHVDLHQLLGGTFTRQTTAGDGVLLRHRQIALLHSGLIISSRQPLLLFLPGCVSLRDEQHVVVELLHDPAQRLRGQIHAVTDQRVTGAQAEVQVAHTDDLQYLRAVGHSEGQVVQVRPRLVTLLPVAILQRVLVLVQRILQVVQLLLHRVPGVQHGALVRALVDPAVEGGLNSGGHRLEVLVTAPVAPVHTGVQVAQQLLVHPLHHALLALDVPTIHLDVRLVGALELGKESFVRGKAFLRRTKQLIPQRCVSLEDGVPQLVFIRLRGAARTGQRYEYLVAPLRTVGLFAAGQREHVFDKPQLRCSTAPGDCGVSGLEETQLTRQLFAQIPNALGLQRVNGNTRAYLLLEERIRVLFIYSFDGGAVYFCSSFSSSGFISPAATSSS